MQQNNYISFNSKSKLDFSYLIIGIDIGKTMQYARATDYEGNELGKKIVFSRDSAGLNKMYIWINSLKSQYKKDNVLIAMEPTGIYWENVYYGLKSLDKSLNVALVDVRDVINVRKLFFGSVKNDTVDSLAIAKTAIFKGFKQRLERSEEEQHLRDLTSFREALLRDSVSIKNKITNILDKVFPEYNCFFKDYFCKSSLVLLSIAFSPEDIRNMKLDSLYEAIKKKSKKCLSKAKLMQLKNLADNSIGISPLSGTKRRFNYYLESLIRILNEINEIENEIDELTKDNEMITLMTQIKGIGTVSAANILAEIGNFNKFKNTKQLIAYCGLNLKINESGSHKGKTTISRNGNSIIRSHLFRIMMPIIKSNEEFKNLHYHNKTRNENPLKPMQSIVALMCKLLRILWGMSKNKCAYNPKVAFNSAIAAAA